MGFRKDTYATIWDVDVKSETFVVCRLSTSKKDKQSGEYEQDFSGFVGFVGSVCASNAAKLKQRDRIKIGDCEVTTTYDKDRNKEYTNYKVYSFEMADGNQNQQRPSKIDANDVAEFVNVEDDVEGGLPF